MSDPLFEPTPAPDRRPSEPAPGASLPIGGVPDNMPRREPPANTGDAYELSDPSAAPPRDPLESATPSGDGAGLRDPVQIHRISVRSDDAREHEPYEVDKAPPRRSAKTAPPPRADPSPRVLILFWVLWLLGSWGATYGVDPNGPVQRWMIYSAITGLMVLWPALRLSQDGPDHDAAPSSLMGRVLLDWISLNLVLQTVIWPLHMIAGWSFPQTFWLDGSLAAWSLLTGACIVAGCRSTRGLDRAVAMLLAVALLVGEPLAMWLINLNRSGEQMLLWSWRASPLQALWHLTTRPGEWQPQRIAVQTLTIASAAALAWIALAMLKPWHGDRR